jgi:hypothetical protein
LGLRCVPSRRKWISGIVQRRFLRAGVTWAKSAISCRLRRQSLLGESLQNAVTIVHLNHNSDDNRDKNLQAFCQSCVLAHEDQRLRDLQAVTTVSGVAAAEGELKPFLIQDNRHQPQGHNADTKLDRPLTGLTRNESTGTVTTTQLAPPPSPSSSHSTGTRLCPECESLKIVGKDGAEWVLSERSFPIERRLFAVEKGMRVSVVASGPPPFLVFGVAGASALVEEICRIDDVYSFFLSPPIPPHLLCEVLRYRAQATRAASIRFESCGRTWRTFVIEVGGFWYDLSRQRLTIIPAPLPAH